MRWSRYLASCSAADAATLLTDLTDGLEQISNIPGLLAENADLRDVVATLGWAEHLLDRAYRTLTPESSRPAVRRAAPMPPGLLWQALLQARRTEGFALLAQLDTTLVSATAVGERVCADGLLADVRLHLHTTLTRVRDARQMLAAWTEVPHALSTRTARMR